MNFRHLALPALLASATCGGTPALDDISRAPEAYRDTLHTCLISPDLPGNHWPAGSAKATCWLGMPQEPSLRDITQTLLQPDGPATLDRRYAQILADHYSDPAHREFLFAAYKDFRTPAGRKVATDWIARAPKSPYAKMARGEAALSLAQNERGTAYTKDTSPAQLDGMVEQLRIAVPLLQSALAAQPRLSPACVDLMIAGSLVSDRKLRDSATRQCMAVDPLSWHVNDQHVHDVDPRWGGSFKQVDKAIAKLAPRVKHNPMLGMLLGVGIGRRANVFYQRSNLAPIAPELDRSALIAPSPYFIAKAGMAADDAGDHAKALAYVSQALRFFPDDTGYRFDRAKVLADMGRQREAIGDARFAAAHAGLDCDCDYDQLAVLLARLDLRSEERVVLRESLQVNIDHRWASTVLCQTDISPVFDEVQASACTRDLVDKYPEDPNILYMRALTLYAVRDPAAAGVDAHFRQVADTKDPHYPAQVRQLENVKAHPRP